MQQHNQLLRPLHLQLLPLGCIQPAGWLQNQLRIQADGLSGHLDEFWPDVADSAWIGGEAEGWERDPYWLDWFKPFFAARGTNQGHCTRTTFATVGPYSERRSATTTKSSIE